MVLGILLYEAVDLAYNTVKLTYNSVSGIYNWYYKVDEKEKALRHMETNTEHYDRLKLINSINILSERLKHIEENMTPHIHPNVGLEIKDKDTNSYPYITDKIEIQEIE
jgi:hypothetical protein